MATNPFTKIARQQEQTWSSLQRRIAGMPYQYSSLFEDDILKFVENKAVSLSSCIGYFAPAVLTTTAFVLAQNEVTIDTTTHLQLPNLYTMVIGYPGTGKSAAIDHAASAPLLSLLDDNENCLMGRATSSALVKHLAKVAKAYVVSSEIYDVLHKLLKSDDETASGDVQLLCKLFSGERTTYHYSTEQTREIEANTPFCILGCTQMQNAAKLIARMDQGHGLIDRFMLSIPFALRPTPQQQTQASDYLATEAIDSFDQIFHLINDIHKDDPCQYKFDDQATQQLHHMNECFTEEVNSAIMDGVIPPKSKKSDLVPRVALALHVFTNATRNLLSGVLALQQLPSTITKETFAQAKTFVEHLEAQKDAMCEFIKSITHDACDQERQQPSQYQIKSAILSFPGPALSYRAFKQSASPKALRTVTKMEFQTAVDQLTPTYGTAMVVRAARASTPTNVFIKKSPTSFQEWPINALVTQEVYQCKYERSCHQALSENIRRLLLNQGLLTQVQVNAGH